MNSLQARDLSTNFMAPEVPSSDQGSGKNGKPGEREVENQDQKVEPPRPKGAPNRYKCCLIIHFWGAPNVCLKISRVILVQSKTSSWWSKPRLSLVISLISWFVRNYFVLVLALEIYLLFFNSSLTQITSCCHFGCTFNHMHRASIFNTTI